MINTDEADENLIALTELLIEHLGLEKCPEPTDTLKHLGADSLDVVELQMRIEGEFNIGEIPDDFVSVNKTVGEIADYIRKARG